MNTTFQPTNHLRIGFINSGLSTENVWNLLAQEPIRNWTVKQLCSALGLDPHLEYDIKNVSNRCGYLVNNRHLAVRIAQGVYRALDEKEREMTTMETGLPVPTDPGPANGPSYEPSAAVANATERVICPECGKTLASDIGLKAHMTRSHSQKLPQDEVFERVAAATKILFPNSEDVFARFEEIGELRKAMFRALAR